MRGNPIIKFHRPIPLFLWPATAYLPNANRETSSQNRESVILKDSIVCWSVTLEKSMAGLKNQVSRASEQLTGPSR